MDNCSGLNQSTPNQRKRNQEQKNGGWGAEGIFLPFFFPPFLHSKLSPKGFTVLVGFQMGATAAGKHLIATGSLANRWTVQVLFYVQGVTERISLAMESHTECADTHWFPFLNSSFL